MNFLKFLTRSVLTANDFIFGIVFKLEALFSTLLRPPDLNCEIKFTH